MVGAVVSYPLRPAPPLPPTPPISLLPPSLPPFPRLPPSLNLCACIPSPRFLPNPSSRTRPSTAPISARTLARHAAPAPRTTLVWRAREARALKPMLECERQTAGISISIASRVPHLRHASRRARARIARLGDAVPEHPHADHLPRQIMSITSPVRSRRSPPPSDHVDHLPRQIMPITSPVRSCRSPPRSDHVDHLPLQITPITSPIRSCPASQARPFAASCE